MAWDMILNHPFYLVDWRILLHTMPLEGTSVEIVTAIQLLWDLIVAFFSSDAVGNLALLISAIIGVGGSYGLYSRRENRRKDRIRNGLKTELEQMSCLSKLEDDLESSDANPPQQEIPSESLPSPNELPTFVFESNTDEIARLDKDTASKAIEFYSSVMRCKQTISDIKNNAHYNNVDRENGAVRKVPMDRQKELYDSSGEIESQRKDLIEALKPE